MTEPSLTERGRLLSDLAATLATLPRDRPQTWRLGEAMRRLVQADGVAITVEYLTDSRTTLCASDEIAAAIESLQEITGEGPGYEAARDGALVVAELGREADQRWPMLVHAVVEEYGVLHVHAVPLHALSGVATLYTGQRRSLSEPLPQVAFLANAVGSALLADAAEQHEGQAQPGDAWSSRSVVHQATGMVMAQLQVTAEDALVLLRAHAYAMGTDVTDVAAEVVGRKINFSNMDVEGD